MEFRNQAGLAFVLFFSLVVNSVQQDGVDPNLCVRKVDLVMVFDGSNSLGLFNFNTMKTTISRAVEVLNFGIDDVRVGAVLYSTGVTKIVPLQTNKEAFQKAVLLFDYPDEATDTDLAIYAAIDILTASQRKDVPMAMMIITDGSSTNSAFTRYAGLVASSQGISIWGVGVGYNADIDELNSISTNGSRQTFLIESFDLIPGKLINLTRIVCNESDVLSTFTIPTTTTTTPLTTSSTPTTILTTTPTTTSTTASTSTTTTTQPTTTSTTTTPSTTTTTTPTTIPTTTTTTPTTTTTTPTTTTTTPTTTTTTPTTTTTTPTTTTTTPTTTTTTPTTTTTTPTTTLTTSTTTPTTTSTTTQVTSTAATTNSTPQLFSNEPSNSTIAPPTEEHPDSHTELCRNSPSIGGVGYVLYPGDCSKVLQCYHNPNTNKTLVVTRQCPQGEFWDQTCFKCSPSWKVNCPYDNCRIQEGCSGCAVSNDTYTMDGVCGGFWSCYNGRSYPKCCPPCYSYLAGYGCKFGNACYDKCGPEDSCLDGIGVCEKIPVWENVTDYATATDLLGLQSTTCSRADFNIIDCRCQVKLMDIFMQDNHECVPYHESNISRTCSGQPTSVPIKQLTDIGTLAFQIGINLTSPDFDITSAPYNDTCDHASRIRLWSDNEGIHASTGDTSKGGALATVLFKNITGELDITVMLHQGKLTLGVRQDKFQFVSTVKAKSTRLCSDCIHSFVATSENSDDCLVNKVQLYNCKPEVTDIYLLS